MLVVACAVHDMRASVGRTRRAADGHVHTHFGAPMRPGHDLHCASAAFDAADQLWRQALDKVTIYDLLCQTLGTVDVPKVDWNKLQLSPSEQATAIIDKIRTNLRSVR